MSRKFSFIIPVYNVSQYLRECLESIRAQKDAEWEAICVDDGSTDGSGDILDEYARTDSRFRVVHQRNLGVSAARNRALQLAVGEYVWFVDGDDCISPNALRYIGIVLDVKSLPPDVVIFDHVCGTCLVGKWDAEAGAREWLSERDEKSFWMFRGSLWRLVIRRSLISGLQFFGMRLGEDVLFSMLVYYRAKRWVKIGARLYFYRSRPGSAITHLRTTAMVRDWLSLQFRILRLFRDHEERLNPKMRNFFVWNSSYIFYTADLCLFRLSQADTSRCFPSWVRLVRLSDEFSRHTWWKRPIIFIASHVPCASLVRILVRGAYWLVHVGMRLRASSA